MEVTLNNRLGEIRREYGYTRAELAEALGVQSPSALYKFEKGERTPNLETAMRISYILKMNVDDIWFLETK